MKPGTFSQVFIQLIFAVKHRESLINSKWESELFKYITGIVSKKGNKLLAINGTSNHIHILLGLKPNVAISDLVREIKKSSSLWINERKFSAFKFEWQEGYGVFSYSKSAVESVIRYVMQQKEHHKKKTFQQEYVQFLEKFEVDYNPKYLFDWNE